MLRNKHPPQSITTRNASARISVPCCKYPLVRTACIILHELGRTLRPASRRCFAVYAVTGHAVMVVESPIKAKKIQQFLGPTYKVLASYGHVRDLPPHEGSVLPDQNFKLAWELSRNAAPRLQEIEQALSGSRLLLLATDPDREGEAISWHVAEEMQKRGALTGRQVQRVTFNEITQSAVMNAIKQPRQVSSALVEAYMARRALDYLVGFNISPILWRKLPGARSAGRVQSVALRLAVQREVEVEQFVPQLYWSVEADLRMPAESANVAARTATRKVRTADVTIQARLVSVDEQKLGPLGLAAAEEARSTADRIEAASLQVHSVNSKTQQRNPPPPFITSTLQQEASHRLGLSARSTMQVAQQLYEGAGLGEGLITYMRTDGLQMSPEAVEELRGVVSTSFGKEYVHPVPRVYKSRVKNAQEAHEAIRPTKPSLTPDKVRDLLTREQAALYEVIWRRTLACQMSSAEVEQTSVEFSGEGGKLLLRANGSAVRFPGFLKLYNDVGSSSGGNNGIADRDEAAGVSPEQEGGEHGPEINNSTAMAAAAAQLLQLKVGQTAVLLSARSSAHTTKPPGRYTESSLIKALEELGIGRPSTYAPIVQLLQTRNYVTKKGRALQATGLGRVLTAFLEHYFVKYVDYGFTSSMEEQLDDVSGGRVHWRALLADFWGPFQANVASLSPLRQTEVYDMLDQALEGYFFPRSRAPNAPDPRTCPTCKTGRLTIKPSKTGGFIGCTNFDHEDEAHRCKYARPLMAAEMTPVTAENGSTSYTVMDASRHILGQDPASGLSILVKTGPYGQYLQLGEEADYQAEATAAAAVAAAAEAAPGGKKKKGRRPKAKVPTPKRVSLPKATEAAAGDEGEENKATNPTTKDMQAAQPEGGEGPQVLAGKGKTASTVTLEEAAALLALPRQLGVHPEDGAPVTVNVGRFGPYVLHDGVCASLSQDQTVQGVTMEQAIERLVVKKKCVASSVGHGAKWAAVKKVKEAQKVAERASRAAAKKAAKATMTGSNNSSSTNSNAGDLLDMPLSRVLRKLPVTPTAVAGSSSIQLSTRKAPIKTAAGTNPGGVGHELNASGKALPRSGYMAYSNEHRADVRRIHPGASSVEVMKLLAEGWRALSEADKAVYTSKSSAGVATTISSLKADATSSATAAKPAPRSGYMAYSNEHRAKVRAANPGASSAEVMKLLAEGWRGLRDADKVVYHRMVGTK